MIKRKTVSIKKNKYASVVELDEALQKLGELEDIEEKINFDIATLFKALNQGVYVKRKGNIIFTDRLAWDNECGLYFLDQKAFDSGIVTQEDYVNLWFKDYGETWSLNKQDLESNYGSN